jgi:YcaO cyclodehydratase, ATP-ad Mg2+-binding
MKPGVITRKDKKYQRGSIRWSSQLPMMKGISLPIAAQDVVEPAKRTKSTKSDRATIRMENIVKQRDMVLKMPYPPPFFNDEPLIPFYGAQLKDPRKDKIADSVGAMDLNPGLAYKKTLGEIIERYCQLYPKEGEQRAFDNYSNLGEQALDPSNLFPFENQNLDVCTKYLHWVSVKNLHTQREMLAPSRLVYLNQDPYDPELDPNFDS